ncbi:DUF364 domain-containing protein [bacterium]|nr:DUF364 domain-containing protein [bacterium]
MKLIDALLESVKDLDCKVKRVCVGIHWTLVESRFFGMAHTYKTNRKVELEDSGKLVGKSALELSQRLRSWEPLEASLGLAALNSLIEPVGTSGNVEEYIKQAALGKTLTIIGRFPFNRDIAAIARNIYFLEIEPDKNELPSFAAEEVIPESDIVVITATTLINKSLPRLLELSKDKDCIVLGPSTPMNDVLFKYGAKKIAGVKVVDGVAITSSIMQGCKAFKRLSGIEPITRFLI